MCQNEGLAGLCVGVNMIDRIQEALRKGTNERNKKTTYSPQNMQHPLQCKCETEIVHTFAGLTAKQMHTHTHLHPHPHPHEIYI